VLKNEIIIEICCGSAEVVFVAEKAGAHRAELNSALFLGGLTPSWGNFVLARRTDIILLPMVRPRPAGFCYTDAEFEAMQADAQLFLDNGADGIVFGFLNADGTIDEERTSKFVEAAGKREAVFSRAFDLVPEPFAAMESLIKCGVKRILTSGGAQSAPEGIEVIKQLVEKARGRIEILPGAGLRPSNIKHFVEYTGVSQVHFSAMEKKTEPSGQGNGAIHFGGALYPREDVVDVASVGKISGMVDALWQ